MALLDVHGRPLVSSATVARADRRAAGIAAASGLGTEGPAEPIDPAPSLSSSSRDTFVWDLQPPADWQRQLEEIIPRGEVVSWLWVAWVPGDPADPVQRWVLYEATPAARVSEYFREAIQGLGEAADDGEALTAEQLRILDFWHREKALLEPFWVIQGERGGHKYRFTETEKARLRLHSLPDDPPLPGALPYAPFDQRVLRQIRAWHALRHAYANIREMNKHRRDRAEQDFRRELLTWLQGQIAGSTEEAIASATFDMGGVQTLQHGRNIAPWAESDEALEEVNENYVRTGRFE